MIPELAIAFLAIVKIGGVILPLFSGYGPGAITARLADAGAKAVITADGAFSPRSARRHESHAGRGADDRAHGRSR
jgi:acyl-coenzyme A synthetase/AMP-(fatty) acid ligase